MYSVVLWCLLSCVCSGYAGYGYGVTVGVGLCDGGKCGQCSAAVYGVEQSMFTSIQLLGQKLQSTQNILFQQLTSLTRAVNNLNILAVNSQHGYIAAIRTMNSQIIVLINQLRAYVSTNSDSLFLKIQNSIISVNQIQQMLHASSKTLLQLTNQIIGHHGKYVQGTISSINQVLVSITNAKQTILKISQSISVVVGKFDRIIASTNAAHLSISSISITLSGLKKSITAFLLTEQTFLQSLKRIITVQTLHINAMLAKLTRISGTNTNILQALSAATSTVSVYQSKLLAIKSAARSVTTSVLGLKAKIDQQMRICGTVQSKLANLITIIKQNSGSFAAVIASLDGIVKQQVGLQASLKLLLVRVVEEERKLTVLGSQTTALIRTIKVKIEQVRTSEHTSANTLKSFISLVQSDVNDLRVSATRNGKTIAKLSSDVNSLTSMMSEIMMFLQMLSKKCSTGGPAPPKPSRCEGPQFQCIGAVQPVCANNGQTFKSACEMRKVACIFNTVYTVLSQGPCMVPTTTPASPCGFTCEPVIDTVCASNGKTYSCPCSMRLDACHKNIHLQVVHKGACYSTTSKPVGRCEGSIYDCGGVDQPVCGSDGNTYSNVCQMKKAACLLYTIFTLKHTGKCHVFTTPATCNYNCHSTIEPVCASDGSTYSCKCQMILAACITKTTITVVHMGQCANQARCEFKCSAAVYLPVCGTDGHTYTNVCELTRRSCVLRSLIGIRSQGPCTTAPPLTTKQTINLCSFVCIGGSQVCGSDGKTYESQCKMMEYACLHTKLITKVSAGPCGVTCPHKFLRIGHNCYYIQKPTAGSSQMDAIIDCALHGANLVSFSSDQEYKTVQNYALQMLGHQSRSINFWTGAQLVNTQHGRVWMWYGLNTKVSLQYAWVTHSTSTSFTCGVMYGNKQYKLANVSCKPANTSDKYGWICKK